MTDGGSVCVPSSAERKYLTENAIRLISFALPGECVDYRLPNAKARSASRSRNVEEGWDERRARQIIESVFKQTSTDRFKQFSLSFCKEANAVFFAANPLRRRADRRDLLELVDREQRDRVDKRQNRRVGEPPGASASGERSEPVRRAPPGGGREVARASERSAPRGAQTTARGGAGWSR